jgi:hypothetical protein
VRTLHWQLRAQEAGTTAASDVAKLARGDHRPEMARRVAGRLRRLPQCQLLEAYLLSGAPELLGVYLAEPCETLVAVASAELDRLREPLRAEGAERAG